MAAQDALPDDDREVLLLSAWEGLSPSEIAIAFDISQITARTRLHRARTRLRAQLDDADRHEPRAVSGHFIAAGPNAVQTLQRGGQMNDHDLQELLVSVAPITDEEIASARLGLTADAMRGAIMATTHVDTVESAGRTPRRRRRGSTRAVVLVTAAAVLIGGTAAAAVLIEARTGRFGGGAQSEEGSGEFIRLDAPGAETIVDDLGEDIPLPPGGSFDRLKSTLLTTPPDGHGVEMTESGILGTLSFDSACQWTGYWLDGYERGDDRQMSDALAMLEKIPSWPAIVASDGGGVVAQLRLRAEGARRNDPSLFMQDYRVNCTGELSPTGD